MRLLLLWLRYYVVLSWPQLSGVQHRRQIRSQCPEYRHRKKVVRKVWLISATTMLFNPVLPIILPVALFTTFLCLAFLTNNPFSRAFVRFSTRTLAALSVSRNNGAVAKGVLVGKRVHVGIERW